MQRRLCACGCGEYFNAPDRAPNRIYKREHGRRDDRPDFVNAICAECNAPIRIEPGRLRFRYVFCSRNCAGKHKSKLALKEYTCEHCNKQFETTRGKRGEHIYCSSACFDEARRSDAPRGVKVQCEQCHKELIVYPSKARVNKRYYCNTTCRKHHIMGENNPAYTGGRGRRGFYGKNWKSQRNAALSRDNHVCQLCGKQPKLKRHIHVHHITPFYHFGDDWQSANDLTNLITLCVKCHKRAEKGEIVIQRKML